MCHITLTFRMGGHSSDSSLFLRELNVSGWIDKRWGLWLRYNSCNTTRFDIAPEATKVRFGMLLMCSSRRKVISDLKLQLKRTNDWVLLGFKSRPTLKSSRKTPYMFPFKCLHLYNMVHINYMYDFMASFHRDYSLVLVFVFNFWNRFLWIIL